MMKFFNVANVVPGVAHPDKGWFSVRNEAAADAAEVMIYNRIGKGDVLNDDGIGAKEFSEAMKGIAPNRPINVRINSVGGNVWDGMAIHSMLASRRQFVTCRIDGVAASIAFVIACAGSKIIMPKNALGMIHPAQGMCYGDDAKMEECAEKLRVHNRAIVSVLAEKCGKTPEAITALMNGGEKWMTGEEAKELGFCDVLEGEEVAFTNCVQGFDFSQFRLVPEVLRNAVNNGAATSGATTKGQKMKKELIIALLVSNGMTVAADASDETVMNLLGQLGEKLKTANAKAGVPENVIALQTQVTEITNQLNAARKEVVTRDVQNCIDEGRIPAAMKDKAISRVMADASYIEELRSMPQNVMGAAPVAGGIIVMADDVKSVVNQLDACAGGLENFKRGKASFENAGERGLRVSNIYAANRDKVLAVMNAGTNTIGADLKRVVILQETIRAFATRLLPLRLFATVFNNVPLDGTDEVVVPYFALQTAASTDYVQANGYVFGGATATASKKITLNKRKYQPLDYSSAEFRRQPYFDAVRLGGLNAEKLGVDVLMDILSVVTLTNFGAAVKIAAANTYTSDVIVDISTACHDAMWPDAGRALIVNTAVDASLKKDSAYKLALNINGTENIRGGKLPNIGGFEYAFMPGLPGNAQNLIGFAAFMSAILAAFAPVTPAAGVRQQLLAYDVATDAATGIAFNYRHWGNPDADVDREVIECAYGYSAGEAAALKRLTSA